MFSFIQNWIVQNITNLDDIIILFAIIMIPEKCIIHTMLQNILLQLEKSRYFVTNDRKVKW